MCDILSASMQEKYTVTLRWDPTDNGLVLSVHVMSSWVVIQNHVGIYKSNLTLPPFAEILAKSPRQVHGSVKWFNSSRFLTKQKCPRGSEIPLTYNAACIFENSIYVT